jgi:hypothetical protein
MQRDRTIRKPHSFRMPCPAGQGGHGTRSQGQNDSEPGEVRARVCVLAATWDSQAAALLRVWVGGELTLRLRPTVR